VFCLCLKYFYNHTKWLPTLVNIFNFSNNFTHSFDKAMLKIIEPLLDDIWDRVNKLPELADITRPAQEVGSKFPVPDRAVLTLRYCLISITSFGQADTISIVLTKPRHAFVIHDQPI
jgi:hypothetical protein